MDITQSNESIVLYNLICLQLVKNIYIFQEGKHIFHGCFQICLKIIIYLTAVKYTMCSIEYAP